MGKNISTRVVLQFLVGALFFSTALNQVVKAQATTTPAAPITGLAPGQITFSVQNLDLETDFYVKLFGFTVVRKNTPQPGFSFRTLTIPGFAIDLVQQDGSALASWPYSRYKQQGYVHFAFYLSELSGPLKVLQDAKVDVTPLKGDDGKINRLIIHDPEGNEFELFIPPKH